MVIQGEDLIFNDFRASDFGLVLDVSFEGAIDSDDEIMITPTISDVFVGERPHATYLSQKYQDHLELTAVFAHNPCSGQLQTFEQKEVRHILRALLNARGDNGYRDLKVIPHAERAEEDYYYKAVVKNISYRTIGEDIVGINVTFQCNGSYAFSPIRSRILDLTANQSKVLYLQEDDDYNNYLLPQVTITAKAAGNLTLTNKTDNNWAFTFTGLQNGEVLKIDCENEIITSSKARTYILNNTNLHFPRLLAGQNEYVSNLAAKVMFQFRERVKVGFVP